MENYLLITSHSPRHQHGFTLVEMLVSVALLAILLGIGVPSFQGFMASSQLTSRTNDMVGSLNLARSEAIRRGARVTMCKSTDGATCTTSGNWEQGWITFVDAVRTGTDASVDVGDTVLQVFQAPGGSVSFKGNTDVASFVSFGSDGRPRLMAGTTQTGIVRVCSSSSAMSNNARAREIEISATGRMSTTTPTGIASTCPTPT